MDIYFLSLIAICVIISIIIAYYMNKKFKDHYPDKMGYMWGFIQGTSPIVMSVLLSICYVIVVVSSRDLTALSDEVDLVMTIAFVRAAVAYGVVKRHRWIFIIHTILTFNIFLWIINGVYIKNRWNEMKYEKVVKVQVIEV